MSLTVNYSVSFDVNVFNVSIRMGIVLQSEQFTGFLYPDKLD